jgi:endonuclease/exonuclease/phosphatase family metal-dependent hydrolase
MSRTGVRVILVLASLCVVSDAAFAQSTLRVLTWNIRHGFEGGPSESTKNVDGQTTLIASLNPQVVVLNEVLEGDADSYETQLESKTPFVDWQRLYVRGNKGCVCDGPMILSRIPFDAPATYLRVDDPSWQYDTAVIHAQITFNGVTIHVFGTHLSFDDAPRRSQLDRMHNFITQYPGPRVVGGDFNMNPTQADYPYWLQKGYTDMWKDRYPTTANAPTHQNGAVLDYWFRSTVEASNVVPTEVFVQPTNLSDHRPVVADLNVQGNGPVPPPAPWVSQDIGSVGSVGSTSYASGTFTIDGSGTDIWGTTDSFRYVYQPLNGDGAIVARVTAIENTSPFAKAGVMIRETLNANSAHALLNLKPDGNLEFITRPITGGATDFLDSASQPPPAWIKLTRVGSQVTASRSANGTTWTQIGSPITLAIANTAYIGLVVSAHDNTTLNTSTFDNVTVNGNLLAKAGFEEYTPPALTPLPGWVSDSARQTPAKSQASEPRSGTNSGVCSTTSNLDCGMYQQVTAPATGTYTVTFWANADRTGGLVGAAVGVGGPGPSANVLAGGFGQYRMYTMTFTATQGDTIFVWMYSPPVPGDVVIDDVSLTVGP